MKEDADAMDDYGPETYGERWAGAYDELTALFASPAETERAVARLAELAGGGPALELAIGTGRVALPLAARGVAVAGVDASAAMVARLREKPGGADVAVTIGDFADVAVDGPFRLVFVVFNSFFALLTQDDQVRCFRNVADRLTGDGVFAIEAFVPDLGRFDRGQRVGAIDVATDGLHLEAARHDPVAQRVDGVHVVVEHGALRTYPVRIRYAWPAELDLMARLAGLRLRERWGGWEREPFTAASARHVSVYERG
jgi:SAM-dependent methyltransferase